jgi:tetratricopeptide (TPR) repeat protein
VAKKRVLVAWYWNAREEMPRPRLESFRLLHRPHWERLVRPALATSVLIFVIEALASEPSAIGQNSNSGQLQTAIAFHERADYAHSIPILKGIVQHQPQNYRANLLLGEDLLLSGKAHDALGPLRAASEARTDDVVALDFMIMAAEAMGDAAMESDAHQSVVSRSGGDERHLLAWGIFCMNRFRLLRTDLLNTKQGQGAELRLAAWGSPGGTQSNRAMLEESAADNPNQAGVWGELGIAQFETGNQMQAQESLRQAKVRQPNEAATLRLEALLAAADNHWEEAEDRLLVLGSRSPAELANALRLWPPNIVPEKLVDGEIWNCVGTPSIPCSLASGSPKGGEGLDAMALFSEGRWEQLKALPVPAMADSSDWFRRGVAEFRTGDCPSAITALERGLKASHLEASLYLQACYAKEEARIENRLSSAENQGALHELRGERLLSLQNDPRAAQREYVEATLSRPKDAYLLSRLAATYRLLGDTAQARDAAASALAVDPHQTSALDTLAQLDMNQRNYSAALVRLKRLADLLPEDQRVQVDLGITYGQLGQPGKAVHYLQPQLKAGFPDPRGTLHALLAAALRKLGRLEEAKRAAAEAVRLSNEEIDSDQTTRSKNDD